MVKDVFGNTSAPKRFETAGPICKEYYTPIDRWLVVRDTENDNTQALLGILKPDPTDASVEKIALKQIRKAVANLGGSLEFEGSSYEIGAISNDPGKRTPFVILGAEPSAVIETLAALEWEHNPYSGNAHTIIEDVLNKKRLLPVNQTTTTANTINHDPV